MTDATPTPGRFRRIADSLGGDATAAALRTPLVVLAGLVSLAVFWGVGWLAGFPYSGPYDATLLHQPLATAKLLLVAVALAATAAVGTLLAGRVRYDAGWAAALFGLMGLRWRGDDVYYTLVGRGASVFVGLAVELLLLAAIAAAAWAGLHWLRERGSASPSLKRVLELPDPKSRLIDRKIASEAWDQRLLALLAGAGVCGLVVLVLGQSQDETQIFFAVAIGGWAGATAAHALVPTRPAPWFWTAPIVTGFVGYLLAWLGTPESKLATGEAGGYLAALARPLPLDWVGAGVPAALLGYVRARTKQFRRVAEAQS